MQFHASITILSDYGAHQAVSNDVITQSIEQEQPMNAIETNNKKLCELYPRIESLTLFVAFQKANADVEPNYQQIIFTGNSDATFSLHCSRDECFGGGFDYKPFIDDMMRNGDELAHGKIVCQGSLGSGDEAQGCRLRSEYRIVIRRKP
ncbi:MAG: hypothetical protein JRE63_06070 [Deltaproteobacteria bacterium]|nr:hypothetical protein [Deltaproteobacteria bacterium]